MRKGQIQQVFIYVMAILVIGFLVLFGYRMIDKLLGQQCDVEEQSFQTGLQRAIERSTRYGTINEGLLSVPCGYEEVCFVDSKYFEEGADSLPDTYEEEYYEIWANTQDEVKVQYNVYAKRQGTYQPVLYDPRIHTLDPEDQAAGTGIVCVDSTNGQFSFLLRGLGNNGIYVYDGS